ncbi:MAG: hypothetical protein EPO35_11940 [Acidobacteria bacterium]|nr:MAG: hypothetical protein EPO35_11940 [Acidobacteriota bacterium]
MFQLKPLSASAIPSALAKAERYRLLNEPEQCVSICEDVLRADPDNHAARITLVLAITDGFPTDVRSAGRAMELVATLPSEYERQYYAGLVAERRGRAVLGRKDHSARAASEWLHEAMRAYEKADAIRPVENDDARLRWNACARTINAHAELAERGDQRSEPVTSE